MIAPRGRAVIWTALTGVPLGVVAAALPGWAAVGASLWILTLVLDAILANRRLSGVAVKLPSEVRLTLGQQGEIAAAVTGLPEIAPLPRLALQLPAELAESREARVDAAVANGEASASWECRPLERGRFPIALCYLELASPLGCWSARSKRSATTTIKVLPGLLKERRRMRAFFLHRSEAGRRPQRLVGQGREFEQLRDYQPGDAFSDIHWKATAKRRRPVTKMFQVERSQEVYVLIDGSRLAQRPTGEDNLPLLERFMAAGLLLALAAERQGDLFGLIAFNDRVRRFLPARNGLGHFQSCRELLSTFQGSRASPDFEEVATFARTRIGRRSLLLVLTDLQDPMIQREFQRGLETLVPHHLVDVVMPRPPGATPLFEGPPVESVDDIYDRLGGHLVARKLEELRRELGHRNTFLSVVDEAALGAEVLARYGRLKQRQAL
jgi:uncharacterized protein (DUF58 family)